MSFFVPRWTQRAALASGILASAFLFQACGSDDPVDPVAFEPTDCDPIDPSECSLPWPSNLFLAESTDTPTGAVLNFGPTTLPRAKNSQIKPDAWNGLDGYGVSTPMLFKAKNLDLSTLPSEADARGSWDGEIGQAALLKVEADGSLTRIPFWVERDQREEASNALIYIRPAMILEEGTRYIVALRNLKDESGAALERSPAFDALVKNQGYADAELSGRQDRFNEVFDALETVGMDREELYLAWDFNTISDEALHGHMLKGRELMLADLNGAGPAMTITATETYQRDDEQAPNYNAHIAYQFTGTFRTPKIVKSEGPGYVFNYDENGELAIAGHEERDFWIRVPYSAVGSGAAPAGLMQYGHGLMGAGSQVRGSFNGRIADTYNYIHFASSWTGMSDSDITAVGSVLTNFSNFRFLSDNMHQGILEFMVLAKGMMHTFPTRTEVTDLEIQVNPDQLYYNGISQGGIYGATYVAVSPDIDVGHLGVPGLNYNLLLQRSVDFDEYAEIARIVYTSPTVLGIALVAAQTLWDMTDPSSYYRHLSADPFPGNNEKYVLLAPAKGDYQVSPLTNLVAANSDAGVAVMSGWGRDISHFGLEETPYGPPEAPYKGSGIVMYNLGNPWAPGGNITPTDEGTDPHGIPRYFYEHQAQMMHFLESGGEIIDVCNGNGCNFTKYTDLSECPVGYTDHRECWTDD